MLCFLLKEFSIASWSISQEEKTNQFYVLFNQLHTVKQNINRWLTKHLILVWSHQEVTQDLSATTNDILAADNYVYAYTIEVFSRFVFFLIFIFKELELETLKDAIFRDSFMIISNSINSIKLLTQQNSILPLKRAKRSKSKYKYQAL